MSDHQAEAIEKLRQYKDDYTQAKITFFPAHKFPHAQEINALFQLAGWNTNFNQTPQEGFTHQYFEGIEVSGFNSHLVNTIGNTLTQSGISDVRKTVLKNKIDPSSPKYPYSEKSIRITIGHSLPEKPTPPQEKTSSPVKSPGMLKTPDTARKILKWAIFSVAYSLPVVLFDFISFQEKSDTWTLPAFLGTGSTCLVGLTLMTGGLSDLWFDYFHKEGESSTGLILNNVACALSGIFTIIVYALIQENETPQPKDPGEWSTYPTLALLAIIVGGISGLASVIASSFSWRRL